MNLSEELRKKAPQRSRLRGHGRQAFLAQRNEIAQALVDGYTAKDIWEHLHDQGTMPIQYRTFIDYVNRYIKTGDQKTKLEDQARAGSPPPVIEKENTGGVNSNIDEPMKKADDLTRRFEYDAKGKSKEDLI